MVRKNIQYRSAEEDNLESLIKEVIKPVKVSDEDIARHWQTILKAIEYIESNTSKPK